MNLEIKPEDLNRLLTETILKSSIGDLLTKNVQAMVDKLSRSYDNPLEKVIEQEVMSIVRTMIHEDFKPKLLELVRSKISEEMVDKFVSKLWDKTWGDY